MVFSNIFIASLRERKGLDKQTLWNYFIKYTTEAIEILFEILVNLNIEVLSIEVLYTEDIWS